MKKYFLFFLMAFLVTSMAKDGKKNDKGYIHDNVLDFVYKSRPLVEVSYGRGSPTIKNNFSFESIENWNLKLGKSKRKEFDNLLIESSERYVYVSYLSSSAKTLSKKTKTDSYNFGFGTCNGIGLGTSTMSVVPYISQSFGWSKMISPWQSYGSVPAVVYHPIEFAYSSIRFSDKSAYGIKAEILSALQLNINYETTVVYRRTLFWYLSGSYLVSQCGYHMLDRFTEELVDGSPIIGSVFNFLLKAGYLYGYHLLREENMNWPFNTNKNEIPLTYRTFNIGFTFVF